MIVTLCGSAKFEAQFKEWLVKLTMMGHVPIGLAVYPSDRGGNKDWYNEAQKQRLDLIHLKKIDASHAILVLNVGGYVGFSTMREIEWTLISSKPVFYLEELAHYKQGEFPLAMLTPTFLI